MRTDYVRIYKSVHTWTGIVSGMALFIAFYAGALTVFKEPLTRWATPPAAADVAPLETAHDLIVKTLAIAPEAAKGFAIHLQDEEHVLARMAWDVRAPDADDHDDSGTRHFGAALDATGAPRVREIEPSPLAGFIDVLHRVVGLPADSDPNRWLMGVIAALYTVALVSGVVVLLPSLVKDFFALRIGKNLKRMWLDAHNVVGIVSLPFHIVMALTAVVFAYHDQIYAIQDKLVHQGKWSQAFQRQPAGASDAPRRDPAAMLTPAQLLQAAHAVAPDLEPTMLQYQGVTGPRAVVRVWGKDTAAVSPRAMGGFAAFDPYSGKLLNTDYLPGRQNTPNLFISSFFALHMASFGGVEVAWLYFLLGMAGAWLFYSGNLLWIESRRRRAARNQVEAPAQRLDTRLMAAATVGVCLGSVCGISLTIAAGKWLYGSVQDLAFWHQLIYYAIFFGCVAWAFGRGAAAASVHLLWLACALTLCIPLTTLLGWWMPGAGPWTDTSTAALGVDATALAGALCFAWMARIAQRRIERAPGDTVWSLHPRAAGGQRRP
ncbi:peptidase [Bordetella genomosp. 10]|uniref:Peptidase n=1 Tax=Bordetella genomosp. 10 TaxID=1416804 RepID=A0A261S1W2_9BORD|nr:PepSY-associated TM helix domain-containing protein [Bordetella genomosp. 10]OZI30977.1 peptidase [Bordetella genomosp. 10]